MAWQPGSGFDPYGAQPGMQQGMQQPGMQAPVGPNNPLNDVFYGAGSGLLGTYLGNSKDYVQSNVSWAFRFSALSADIDAVALGTGCRCLEDEGRVLRKSWLLLLVDELAFVGNRLAGTWQLTTFSTIFK